MITCADKTKPSSSSNGPCELVPCKPCHCSAYTRVLEAKALHEGIRHETLCHSFGSARNFKDIRHYTSGLAGARRAEHDRSIGVTAMEYHSASASASEVPSPGSTLAEGAPPLLHAAGCSVTVVNRVGAMMLCRDAAKHEAQSGPKQLAADSGDAEFHLDDGQTLLVHSVLLAIHSPVISDAIRLASDQGQVKLRVPLPDTEEAKTLLSFLYSPRSESLVLGLALSEYVLLLSVCHRFCFEDVLSFLDESLAKHIGQFSSGELRAHLQPAQFEA